MAKLNKQLVNGGHSFPGDLQVAPARDLPEKVLQFGEGNFLRGFVDWMIHRMNRQGLFNGRVVVVQPIAQGLVDKLNEQDGLYTLLLRGVQNGQVVEQKEVISSVSRGINPYADFEGYLKCAENPELRFIVSNTTEAGIAFSAADKPTDTPPASFPGKLTLLLKRRFDAFKGDKSKGFVLIPCELIERNGQNLRQAVVQTARHFGFSAEFIAWVEQANHFTSTLVDRIVTGYPKDEAAQITRQLGYEDALLDTAEVFHLWVIEGDRKLAEELPLTKVGLDVIWTEDQTPYRTRKVRILNGAHTMTVLGAYLAGRETVKECMDDELIRTYMQRGIYEEIIPTLDLPKKELEDFAAAVTERFSNPFIKHQLLSIALNSTSKFKSRVLPSIKEYIHRKNAVPRRLAFSLAALIAFYKGGVIRDGALIGCREGSEYRIQDDLPALEFFQGIWTAHAAGSMTTEELARKVLAKAEFWGSDLNALPGFAAAVAANLQSILDKGVRQTLKALA